MRGREEREEWWVGGAAGKEVWGTGQRKQNFFFSLFRATLMAHGGSQARGGIRAVAATLCHSHSHAGSKPRLQPTQLTATPDP